MPIKFSPEGFLDVASDPSKLPFKQSVLDKVEFSGAMRRCTNMTLDRGGMAKTRWGITKLNSSAIDTSIHGIIEQGGYRYVVAGTSMYRDESAITVAGLTSARWSLMLYNPYGITTQTVFGLNGTDRKKIEASTVYEWGIAAPAAAPTVAVGAGTGLTGTYYAKVTYCRKSGTIVVCESNPSPASASQALTNQSLSVTWAASTDPQVTHVRVYRTQAGGSTYYHDQDVAVGAVTVDTTTADGSLGSSVSTDHDRPPLGTIVAGPTYQGYCFILKDNLLYWCKAKYPEYWPDTYYVEVCPIQNPLRGIIDYFGTWYAANDRDLFQVSGTGTNSFATVPMKAATGTRGVRCLAAVRGTGLLHLGPDGVYLFTQSSDTNITKERFKPIFEGTTVGSIPGLNQTNIANCILQHFNSKVYFAYPEAGSTYPDNLLVFDLGTGKTVHYEYPFPIREMAEDVTNARLLAGDTSGYIWHLEHADETDDNGTAISWQIESKAYTDQVYKYFPRYAKYDLDLGTGATANAYILLNDTSVQTHAITSSRSTKQRLITGGTGDRLGVRITGTGPVTFYAAEVE